MALEPRGFLPFVALSLFLSFPLFGQAPPKPAEIDEVEMGRSEKPASQSNADPILLEKFKLEYQQARGKTRLVFAKYLPSLGAGPMLDYLEQIHPACHVQAHDLGRALYALRGDVGVALRECGTRCTSACMHGVVGEAFGNSDPASIAEKMSSFCDSGAMKELYRPGNCAHGIGHALMFTTGDDVDAALNACLYFHQPGMRYYCATGIYMELLVPVNKGKARPVLHDPCDLHPEFAAACFRYRARTLLREGQTRDKLLDACLALDEPMRRGCFHGLGSTLISLLVSEPNLLRTYCTQGSAEDQALCVEGAMEKLADFNRDAARPVCDVLGPDLKKICLDAVESGMYALDKPTMRFYFDGDSLKPKPLAKRETPKDEHAGHHH
jgi:hypothetical protein